MNGVAKLEEAMKTATRELTVRVMVDTDEARRDLGAVDGRVAVASRDSIRRARNKRKAARRRDRGR